MRDGNLTSDVISSTSNGYIIWDKCEYSQLFAAQPSRSDYPVGLILQTEITNFGDSSSKDVIIKQTTSRGYSNDGW